MKKWLFIVPFAVAFFSCEEPKVEEKKEITWSQEESSNLNKDFVAEEEAEIEAFLERHKDWKMNKTGTGLRYFIYKDSVGEPAKAGMIAEVNYSISLLDGTKCYDSDSLGSKNFKIDKSDLESGLHQGMKFLSIGDKAKFIIPSPIALGLTGDNDKIPPLQAVIYDIELVGLE